MIIIEEINGEIAKLEAQTQTYQTIEKLAALYTVRDHNVIADGHSSDATDARTSAAAADGGDIRYSGGTEFAQAIDGKQAAKIWPVLDELMMILKELYPDLYKNVIRELA